MGALYLASKLEECTLRLRDLVNVYDLLLQRHKHELHHPEREYKHTAMSYWSQTYYDLKDAIVVAEMQILKRLGFDVQVKLPYGTLVNYLQVLGLIDKTGPCPRAWAFLNDA
jgi:cyclin L